MYDDNKYDDSMYDDHRFYEPFLVTNWTLQSRDERKVARALCQSDRFLGSVGLWTSRRDVIELVEGCQFHTGFRGANINDVRHGVIGMSRRRLSEVAAIALLRVDPPI